MTYLSIEYIFIVTSVLILLSVLANKASEYLGVPALLFFLLIGMIAGSDGIGGIEFDNVLLAQAVGVGALVSILFTGGLDTHWRTIRPIAVQGIMLSTLGVMLTTLFVAMFAYYFSNFSINESLLLGAIVSSTDAAAVFSILRSNRMRIKKNVQAVIEFESASNDPMAVLLTVGIIQFILLPNVTFSYLISMFFVQVLMGLTIGLVMGTITPWIINKLHLEYKGLYPVLTIGLIMLTYGFTSIMNGNGFLAVYLVGLRMSSLDFENKKELIEFHEGLTWLMQIIMFLTLGLLVFPSKLLGLIGGDVLLGLFLILIARPLSVFITLFFSKFQFKELAMISWVGLRGAVPIILATFPVVAGIPNADTIFNHVFFIVITSILIQGTMIPFVARVLGMKN